MELIKANPSEFSITLALNILVALLVFGLVSQTSGDKIRDVLGTSGVLLGITTATLVFFGDYVEKTTDELFGKKEQLAKYAGTGLRIAKVLLKLIFLTYLLWWSLILDGASLLLAIAATYDISMGVLGVASLAFLSMGILTVLVWMSLFVLTNTPGKFTYQALVGQEGASGPETHN